MRRFGSHAFTVCAAVSLLLCVLACVLWERSYRVQEQYTWRPGASLDTLHVFWSRGHLACTTTGDTDYGLEPGELQFSANPTPVDLYTHWRTSKAIPGPVMAAFGFAINLDGDKPWPGLLVPFWFVAWCAAALPAVWAVGLARRSRRRRAGLCRACGYDLRASPERCPECGLVRAG